MTRLICNTSMSLDGFVAGPGASLEEPLGKGGEQLHAWAFDEQRFREQHGMTGGERGRERRDHPRVDRDARRDRHGTAHVQRWRGTLERRPERGRLVG